METNPPLRLMLACQKHFSAEPTHLLMVPGREMWMATEHCSSGHYTLILPDIEARTTFNHRSLRRQQTRFRRPLPSWTRYATAIIPVLNAADVPLPAMRIIIVSDEPPGPRFQYALGMALVTLAHTHHEKPCDEPSVMALMQQLPQGL